MNPGSTASRAASRLLILVLYAFLLAPLFPVVVLSFSNDSFLGFPPASWGVRWYAALPANERFVEGLRTSLIVGVSATAAALFAGVLAAYAIARLRVPGRAALLAMFTAPLVVPSIVLGLGSLLVLAQLRLNGTLFALIATHTVLVSPFVVRIVLTGLATLPDDVESAAASLGAKPVTVFRRITVPLLRPALLAAGGLCFLISFDEVAVTLFVAGPSRATLPVEVFRYTSDHTDPQVAALSVLLIVVSVGIILLVERGVGLMRAVGR